MLSSGPEGGPLVPVDTPGRSMSLGVAETEMGEPSPKESCRLTVPYSEAFHGSPVSPPESPISEGSIEEPVPPQPHLLPL